MGRQIRNYRDCIERLKALPLADWRVRTVATIWDYPWFTVERQVRRSAPTILLSGGMHGEEPAGVEGVLSWLESGQWRKWDVNWLVFPCINPYGWERNQRRNRQNRDINRQFHRPTDTPESELIKRLVNQRRFLFSLEFHEDVDATGYYLYELRRRPPFIGKQILKAVSRITPINQDAIIDGNQTTAPGLIHREYDGKVIRTRRHGPMALHLFDHCTDHILGSESALTVPLATRARAHVTALITALKLTAPES